MSTDQHILYAWPLSYYSGKTRAYLRYKAIPHVEQAIRLWHFKTIKRKTGATVMPVVVTPQGEWLQDTSDIMDQLERRYPEAPVLPSTPRQRLAALLLEVWGDEYWLPSAMHYRWSFDENFRTLFQREGGDQLMPFAPRLLKNRLIASGANQMRGFLPGLGVVPEQLPIIEAWTIAKLDALDAHFATLPYLLGTRPSYGDFGLIGPLFAHLGRDPYPRRVLIQPRPHLERWIARMQAPETPRGGAFLPDDEVPASLAPLLHSVFGELWPFLERTLEQTQAALPQLAPGRGFTRSLGMVQIPMAGLGFKRRATPFSLWMAQRPLDAYAALDGAQRASADAWLAGLGAGAAMKLSIPRLRRHALHVMPEG